MENICLIFQIRHVTIAHSTGEPVPHPLIGDGEESSQCETETDQSNSTR